MPVDHYPFKDVAALSEVELLFALKESHTKLRKAIAEINDLDQHINTLRRLYQRAEKNNSNGISYNLRMQISIVSGMKVMYHQYAEMMDSRLVSIRTRIREGAAKMGLIPSSGGRGPQATRRFDISNERRETSTGMPAASVNAPGGSANMPEASVNAPGGSANMLEASVNAPGGSANIPEGLAIIPEGLANIPGTSANIPEASTSSSLATDEAIDESTQV